MAMSPADRATALLIPDAMPDRSAATEDITVVVSGATVTTIPNPSTTIAGKNVVQYCPPTPGRASNANPAAATIGPATSGPFDPYRSTSPPAHLDSTNMIEISGSNAPPAAVAEYPCT